MKRKHLIAALLLALAGLVPAWAVFKEKDLPQTLSVLHFELRNTYEQLERTSKGASQFEAAQHKRLVELIEHCNELSIMLYSQQQDFTFDLTYALEEVTNQYVHFNATRLPYEDIVSRMEIEVDRFEKMVMTLKNLPPVFDKDDLGGTSAQDTTAILVDSLLAGSGLPYDPENPYILDRAGRAERDSCVFYAQKILDMYWETLFRIDEDNTHYAQTDRHLKEAFDYAQERYHHVQKKIFIDGQTPYHKILRRFGFYWTRAIGDCREKYSTTSPKQNIVSEWRGPMVVWFSVLVLIYIIVATILANLLVRILMRKVKYLQTPYFQEHKLMFILLAGVVIFALTVMLLNLTIHQNFVNMAIPLLAEFAWLLAAIFTSLLIRLRGSETLNVLKAYIPMILMGLIIITFRIIFIPNSLINIVFPPVLLLFTVWQFIENRRRRHEIKSGDMLYMWIFFGVLVVSTSVALCGYVMMALVLVIWWIFQLTVIQTILAVYFLLSRYYDNTLRQRIRRYREKNPLLPLKHKGSFIEVSWGYDLLKMVIVPVATVWSIPLCIYMAGNVFDLSGLTMVYFYKPIVNVENVIHLSLLKVMIIITLFFVFRYLNYASKAFYRVWKTRSVIRKLDDGLLFKESDINFNLVENIISLVCWGLFVIISFLLLKIPTSSLTIITTGLAAGIGFALKDVLNNFFYGVQLMSGRLRVGDIIECDGIRGTVDSMGYQSTQIVATDGSIIAFPNSSLFAKNFKNLTRNHQYELLRIDVGVKYGTDVDQVRQIVTEALKVLQVRDKYGRDVVDPKFGVVVRLKDFGDNSINLQVLQQTTVETHFTYAAQAKEIIYNALQEHGIEIPFPQRDIHIKQD